MSPRIHIVPILQDNYCYVIESADGKGIIIDPGEAAPVQQFLKANDITPTLVLNTHHHGDHVAGNAAFNLPVGAPLAEMSKIPAATHGYKEGDVINENGVRLEVIETPGHTLGHIVFYAPELSTLFSGDTLFSMGCGRLFEGTAADMFASFQKIKKLPVDTLVYCGHEYTLSNGNFAKHVEPDNAAVKDQILHAQDLLAVGRPTIPVTLETELKINPFLRAPSQNDFAELRLRKDKF
ncbi:MAG: hydroxyacylglutathione hydrolase [Micavibrio aeruginosavorus]|uniref:Hydroxyacylglutathione hydrolase n=1 Tax=Micavibrio aeruginosavorus TaxID=349221 RepID=A0A2W5MY16_9BACT|nr:MAG: hydroxyacylglutathione hydrolase [Micavibrio aeruginosavorus]